MAEIAQNFKKIRHFLDFCTNDERSNFGIKKSKVLMRKWIVHGWYKNQKNVENFGNFELFWPYLEKYSQYLDLSIF